MADDEKWNFEIAKHEAVQLKVAAEEVQSRLNAKKMELVEAVERITNRWTEVNAELIAEEEAQRGIFVDHETKLRNAAVAHFEETGDKQIGHGISIRVDTKIDYDEDDAVAYAISHNMPTLLKIDGPKFKKFVSITPVSFVTATPKPTAVVSYSKELPNDKK